jgi:hypothetical protein
MIYVLRGTWYQFSNISLLVTEFEVDIQTYSNAPVQGLRAKAKS